MAHIVLGLGLSVGIDDAALIGLTSDRHAAYLRGLEQARQTLVESRPDVLLLVSGSGGAWVDGVVPALLVYWGETIGDQSAQRPVSTPLARHLIERLTWADFDVAQARELPAGHAARRAADLVQREFPDSPTQPFVPIVLNTTTAPNQPTARRCLAIGQRIRAAVEECDCGTRIGVLGLGGLSHFAVDEDLNQQTLKAFQAGDEHALTALPREQLDAGLAHLRVTEHPKAAIGGHVKGGH